MNSMAETLSPAPFAAETHPDHIGPAPRRLRTPREQRAEAETVAARKVGR